jgi:two-component system, OmpR family, osmolarity sensor histidine kinase EnvZ
MKIIPESIVGRVAWLVAFVGLLSFLMHVIVVSLLIRPLFSDMTLAVVGQVVMAKALVTQSNPTPTPQDVQKYMQPGMRIFMPANTLSNQLAEPPYVAQPTIAPMRAQLPADIQLGIPRTSSSELQKQLLFDFEHQGQIWRISYDVFPPIVVFLGSILGWLSLVALGVFASLYAGVRLVTRPMSEVAQQIVAQGQSIQPLPQPKHAAREVRAMVGAFNQLVDEVKSADAKKMQMLAGLSHDLRTPLTRLSLRAETCFQQSDTEEFEQDISAMQKMIDQFMAYVHGNARASLGREESVVEQLSRLMSQYPDDVCSLDIALKDTELTLPKMGFQRLMTNLLDNALAYGAVPIEVTLTQRVVDHSPFAAITVYDSGKGMSAIEFDNAKQPFVRLGDAQGVGHSGLGLAIGSQIADQLSGQLSTHKRADGMFGVEFAWPISRLKTNH